LLIVEKVSALLTGVTRRDVEHLTPEQRRRLAFVLRSIAQLCDNVDAEAPKPGILRDLRQGDLGR
jgi:hypothetical protein